MPELPITVVRASNAWNKQSFSEPPIVKLPPAAVALYLSRDELTGYLKHEKEDLIVKYSKRVSEFALNMIRPIDELKYTARADVGAEKLSVALRAELKTVTDTSGGGLAASCIQS
jgi:hypothetical protein